MDVGEMQRRLSHTAAQDPTHQFRDLYSLLCNAVWLRVAVHHIQQNAGSETAGIDGKTMSNFRGNFDGYIEELTTTLKAETFEPCPVRRVYIPKPHSEKKRPLGIPILFDRIVQEALRMILEPIWEADFSVHSYGFRPNRSTYDAIAYIGNRLKGNGSSYQWVIEGDIKSYFDTIPHRRLIKAVKKRVADRKIRDLLWKFLRAGVMHRGQFEETLTGTPQGGIVSPLLANIYLDALDKYMESKYLQLSDSQRRRRRDQGKSNFLYVRYADDWVVLCNGTKAEAQDMKEELKTLLEHLGLTLSEEKTKLTHITEGFLFLGYQIIRAIGTNGHMVPKVLIPESAITKNRHKVRGMLAPHTFKDSVKAKIIALNRVTNGWCQYYRVTSHPSAVFNKRRYELFWDMAHWLGRKWERSIPQIIQEYYDPQGNTFRVHTLSMVLPSDHKAKRLLTTTWHNPYTAKDAIIREKLLVYESAWSGQEHRQGRMDLREEAIALKGTICAINGPDCESKGVPLHPSEVHGDHIIARSRFKNPKDADRLGNIQIVCTNCHRTKTQNDLRVLSRMRSKPQVRF